MAQQEHVTIKNINLGGLADSPYLGIENSVADMVGLDIHSEPGVIKVNQQLAKESGSTVDDLVKATVTCSDGNTYLFGSTNGKIWKRDSNGTYTLEDTTSPSSGTNGVMDAEEHGGFIYYSMNEKLGRVAVPTSGDVDWSTRDDSWKTFTNGDADFHPMRIVNLVLFIGDAHLIAQVDEGTFTADALDIQKPLRVKALGRMGTKLLIGTYVNTNILKTQIFSWNTWSVSFQVSDTIPEVGVNSFLETDNDVIVNAGTKGRLYFYNGNSLQPYTRVPGVFPRGSTDKVVVHHNANLNYNGLPLFGLSQSSGNAVKYGIYSLGRYSARYDTVLNLEYVVSLDNTEDIEIGAIEGIGDIFLVTWKNTDDGSHGVDKLDLSNKYSGAYFTTRVIQGSGATREGGMYYGKNMVAYRTIPANTDVKIYHKLNHASSFTEMDATVDTDRLVKESDNDVGMGNTLQFKIELTASGDDAPEIEGAFQEIVPEQSVNE